MRATLLLAAALCGCSTQAPAMKPSPNPPAACDAAPVQSFVGRAYDAAAGDELRKRSGAQRVRTVRPGQMVTMEFDEQRLTVEVDARGRIAAVRCG